MSATVEALALAWRVAPPETRELAGDLLTRARNLNGLVGVPESEPGWRELATLGADSTPEQVTRVLTEYESLAERYDGMPLATVYSTSAPDGAVIPTWQSVERYALDRMGQDAARAVRELAAAYAAVAAAGGVLGSRVTDARARVYVLARLSRAQRRPASEGSGLGKLLLGLLVVYVLGSVGDRK